MIAALPSTAAVGAGGILTLFGGAAGSGGAPPRGPRSPGPDAADPARADPQAPRPRPVPAAADRGTHILKGGRPFRPDGGAGRRRGEVSGGPVPRGGRE